MSDQVHLHNRWERWLSLFARLRPGEGRAAIYFMCYGFLVMFSYYMLKTLREPLLLTEASAEIKSYAYAAIALVLLFVVPAYGALYRRLPNRQLNLTIGAILVMVQAIFFLLTLTDLDIGFAYYVWVGVFGVLITAQFWAFAADIFNVKTGQRLFPLIMVGVSLGGLVGPYLAGHLLQLIDPSGLILIVLLVLFLMLPMNEKTGDAVPELSRGFHSIHSTEKSSMSSGFSVVFKNRYLLLIALLMVLLNWVNTTGEYILAELVVTHVDTLIAEDPSLKKSHLIGSFYGNFFFLVNSVALIMQLLIVPRLVAWIGVQGVMLILPVIVLIGYGVMVFIPVFSIIRFIKVAENSVDYSFMNTARHLLFLPLSASDKYQSKITIDGFFWRFGDLLQAGAVYVGLNLLGFELVHFAILNMLLALLWLALALRIGKHFTKLKSENASGEPPRLLKSLRPQQALPGNPVNFRLPANLFHCDPGDIIDITIRPIESESVAEWLSFDPVLLEFSGTPPGDINSNTWLTVRATNFDGQWAEVRLGFIHMRAL